MSLIEYIPAIVSAIATIVATIVSWILSARTTEQSMIEKHNLDKKRDLVKITLPLEIEAYAKADAAHAAYIVDCIDLVHSINFNGSDEIRKKLAASGEKASVTRGNPFILLDEKCLEELEKIDKHCSNAFLKKIDCLNNRSPGLWDSEINSARKALISYREQVKEIFRNITKSIDINGVSDHVPEGETPAKEEKSEPEVKS
ncbi:MAG: hypothetical protein VB016_00885 [Methanomassiliicoccaceae archaeon]|nr:hypothetical protein [Methanomassiliicoccaceae archaeon]HJJ50182.1 hypothetical protein [Methanocorpusculum sp.]